MQGMYIRAALYKSTTGVGDQQSLTRQVQQSKCRTSGQLWVYDGELWKQCWVRSEMSG